MRRVRSTQGFVTIGTVAGLLAATLLVLVGSSPPNALFDVVSPGAWLRSGSTLLHVDGLTGEPDSGVALPDGLGDPADLEIVQGADGVYIRNTRTGQIARLDEAGRRVSHTRPTDDPDIEIAAGGGHTWLVDRGDGSVQQIDPRTLDDIGDPVPVADGDQLGGHLGVDDDGLLWLALPDAGRLAAIEADTDGSRLAAVRTIRGGNGAVLTIQDGAAVATIGRRPATLTVDTDDTGDPHDYDDLDGPLEDHQVAEALDGPRTWVIADGPDGPTVGWVDPTSDTDPGTTPLATDASLDQLDAPLVAGERVYVPDGAGDHCVLHVLDADTGEVRPDDQVDLTPDDNLAPTDPETNDTESDEQDRDDSCEGTDIFVRDDALWVNHPGADDALVIESDGDSHSIAKRAAIESGDLPGLTQPPIDTDPTTTDPQDPGTGTGTGTPDQPPPPPAGDPTQDPNEPQDPPDPTSSAPDAPTAAQAALNGDTTATITWTPPPDPPNAPVTGYTITAQGGPATIPTAGAGTTTLTITGLAPDTTYTFTISATNAIGAGNPATTNPITTPGGTTSTNPTTQPTTPTSNNNPIINIPPSGLIFDECDSFNQVIATDPDGDPLTLTINHTAPAGTGVGEVDLNTSGASITGSIGCDFVSFNDGQQQQSGGAGFDVDITVSDGRGGTTTYQGRWNVNDSHFLIMSRWIGTCGCVLELGYDLSSVYPTGAASDPVALTNTNAGAPPGPGANGDIASITGASNSQDGSDYQRWSGPPASVAYYGGGPCGGVC